MTEKPCDYGRWWYENHAHHVRYAAYVKAHGLTCQACGGRGEHGGFSVCSMEPPEPCGWCESTGLVTRWLRGQYLTYMRSIKPKRKAS